MATAGTNIAAQKAYLPVETANLARLTLVFDDETSGIETLNNEHGTLNGNSVYNLNGLRVAHPVKSIYIQNGKKVIIK